MKLRLIEKRPEAGDAIIFVFEPASLIKWSSGQYIKYHLPHNPEDDRGIERWFTISSAPFEKNVWITTRISPKRSSFKSRLNEMKIGDEISADEPEGDFIIEDYDKEFIFIAGGIGITPFRSILKQAAHDKRAINVDLLYGVSSRETAFFAGELEKLADLNPNLKIRYITEPERIDANVIKQVPGYSKKLIYVSGPELMVEAFEKILDHLGIPKNHQKYDYFPGYEWTEVTG